MYIVYEAIFLVFIFLGINYQDSKLSKVILTTSLFALLFYLAQKYQYLPYLWQQPILILNHEFVDNSFTYPSFFGNPSPMCLFFVLASYSIKNQSHLIKICYLILCLPMILLSDSTIGIFLFFLSTLYLFIKQSHSKYLYFIAVITPMIVLLIYPKLIQRPFETRYPLYKLAFSQLSIIGNGPGTFHLQSGQLKGEDTTKNHLTRNQFHPHNDLLFYLYSYGLIGFILRCLLYLFVLYIVYLDFEKLPLLLFLVQIQFTPDSFSLPASLLFFFYLGQCISKFNNFKDNRFLSLIQIPANNFYMKSIHYIVLVFFIWNLSQFSLSFQNIVNSDSLQQENSTYFSSPAYQYNLGVHYLKLSHFNTALSTLTQLQKVSPNFQDIDYILAHIYYSQKKPIQAKRSLQEKLRIDPYHVYTYLFLADIFVELGDKNSAIATVKRGLLCLPNDNLLIKRLSSLE
ncbi:MAG: hypothetical protein KC646_06805 [Candidatus Cloacimonetes bacterium]|nr:hypothetical protein [Candidatus Cloacimonadota bacterium]